MTNDERARCAQVDAQRQNACSVLAQHRCHGVGLWRRECACADGGSSGGTEHQGPPSWGALPAPGVAGVPAAAAAGEAPLPSPAALPPPQDVAEGYLGRHGRALWWGLPRAAVPCARSAALPGTPIEDWAGYYAARGLPPSSPAGAHREGWGSAAATKAASLCSMDMHACRIAAPLCTLYHVCADHLRTGSHRARARAALLMHWPLTLYRALLLALGADAVLLPRAAAAAAPPLAIHYLGAHRRASQCLVRPLVRCTERLAARDHALNMRK